MNNTTYINELPPCDLCDSDAHFYALTTMDYWANLCDLCFGEFGIGLGIGLGQMLKVESECVAPRYDWYELNVVTSDAAESMVERAMEQQ